MPERRQSLEENEQVHQHDRADRKLHPADHQAHASAAYNLLKPGFRKTGQTRVRPVPDLNQQTARPCLYKDARVGTKDA